MTEADWPSIPPEVCRPTNPDPEARCRLQIPSNFSIQPELQGQGLITWQPLSEWGYFYDYKKRRWELPSECVCDCSTCLRMHLRDCASRLNLAEEELKTWQVAADLEFNMATPAMRKMIEDSRNE
jgi:hypothetical protein